MNPQAATVKTRGKMKPEDQIAYATQMQDYNRAPEVTGATGKGKTTPLLLTGAFQRFSQKSAKFDRDFIYVPMFRVAGKYQDVRAYLIRLNLTPEQAENSIRTQAYNYMNYQDPNAQIQIRDPKDGSNAIIVSSKAEFEAEIARRKAAHPPGSAKGPQKDLRDLIRLVALWEGKTPSAAGQAVRGSRSATLAEKIASLRPSAEEPRGHWLNVTGFKGDLAAGGATKGSTKAPIPKGASQTFAQVDPNDPDLSRIVFDPTKLVENGQPGGAVRFLVRYYAEFKNQAITEQQAYQYLISRPVGATPPAPVHIAPTFAQQFAPQGMQGQAQAGQMAHPFPQGQMAPPTFPQPGQFPPQVQQQTQPFPQPGQFPPQEQHHQPQIAQSTFPQPGQFPPQVQQQTQEQHHQPQIAQPAFPQPQFQQPSSFVPLQQPFAGVKPESPKTQLPKPIGTPSKLSPLMLPPKIQTPSSLTAKPQSPQIGGVPSFPPIANADPSVIPAFVAPLQ